MNINKNLIWIKFLIWIHLACMNKKVCKVCIVTFDQSYITLEISLSTFWLSFIFFIFAFWPIETTTPNLKGLAHSDSSKSTTRVILSNEHMTNFFGRKVTWFTTTKIPNKCLFPVVNTLLTKRMTCVFDRSPTVAFVEWYSRESKIWRQKTYIANIWRVYYFHKFGPFKCLVWRGSFNTPGSCSNNITLEKKLSQLPLLRFVGRLFSDKVKKRNLWYIFVCLSLFRLWYISRGKKTK